MAAAQAAEDHGDEWGLTMEMNEAWPIFFFIETCYCFYKHMLDVDIL